MKIAATLAILAALIFVSSEDAAEEERYQDHYCDMVKTGAWPDYDKAVECKWRKS